MGLFLHFVTPSYSHIPLLFIIYVNDLISFFETYKGINIEMYADDTKIYSSNCDVSIAV